MSSEIKEVIAEAAMMLASTGTIGHLFTGCRRGGEVHAQEDADGISCCACRVNRLARVISESDAAVGGVTYLEQSKHD